MATIMKADGSTQQIEGEGLNGKLTLEQMQAAVGGYIEHVPGSNLAAYCNEDGRLKNLPLNRNASAAFGQVLVGDVLVLTETETMMLMEDE